MTPDEIVILAKSVGMSDPYLASILYAFAGAKGLGNEDELADVVCEWAKMQIIKNSPPNTYNDWLKNG